MTHEKTSAKSHSSAMARLGHLGRVSVFFLTAGFAYPNVMVEGMDLTRIQGNTDGDLYKKK
jgi:hypothetical protein